MSSSRLRAATLAAGADATAATTLTAGAAAQAHTARPAASSAASKPIVTEFKGSIRTGPLADLSLSGALSLAVDPSTHAIDGVLVDGDGAGHTYLLAHVGGTATSSGAKLVFHTQSGHVIRGTSAKPLASGQIMHGSLTAGSAQGDWIARVATPRAGDRQSRHGAASRRPLRLDRKPCGPPGAPRHAVSRAARGRRS